MIYQYGDWVTETQGQYRTGLVVGSIGRNKILVQFGSSGPIERHPNSRFRPAYEGEIAEKEGRSLRKNRSRP